MNFVEFRKFLNLYQYGIDNCRQQESINYIIDRMKESEKLNKILTFDLLEGEEYSPNVCLDRSGHLYFNTKTLKELFEAYCQAIKYVNTEIANLEKERFLVMHEIAEKPFITIKEEKDG